MKTTTIYIGSKDEFIERTIKTKILRPTLRILYSFIDYILHPNAIDYILLYPSLPVYPIVCYVSKCNYAVYPTACYCVLRILFKILLLAIPV